MYFLFLFFRSQLSDVFNRLAVILSKMGVLPFTPRIPVSVTQQLQREHPFVNQLNCDVLCFMIEKALYCPQLPCLLSQKSSNVYSVGEQVTV